jgi:hypothetical protein
MTKENFVKIDEVRKSFLFCNIEIFISYLTVIFLKKY